LLVWSLSVLSMGLGGCFTKRRQFAMPPGLTAAAKPAPQPRSETPPDIQTSLPQIDIPPFVLEKPKPIEAQAPKPVPTRRPSQTPSTPTPTTPGTTTEGETQPTTPTPPVPAAPQLSEILPEDRRKQYEADFAACVSRARSAVSTASNRRLTNHNQETVKRILTFLQQAEDSKVRDLATALQLARRADLLGQDLLKSLR
jgi:hypothetical protein